MESARLVIPVISILLLWGCSSDDDVVAPQNDDMQLQESLIGAWSIGDTYRIWFHPDRTYVDSLWALSISRPGERYLSRVGTGKYSVVNSILFRSDVHHTVLLDSGLTNPGCYDPGIAREIELEGNRLVCQPVDILNCAGQFSTDLQGVWSVTTEVWSGNYSGLVYSGRLLRKYTFVAGSDSCTVETQYLDGHPELNENEVRQYYYSPPLLNLSMSYTLNIRVDFKDQSMYWYYIYEAYSMTRDQ